MSFNVARCYESCFFVGEKLIGQKIFALRAVSIYIRSTRTPGDLPTPLPCIISMVSVTLPSPALSFTVHVDRPIAIPTAHRCPKIHRCPNGSTRPRGVRSETWSWNGTEYLKHAWQLIIRMRSVLKYFQKCMRFGLWHNQVSSVLCLHKVQYLCLLFLKARTIVFCLIS